MLIEKKRIELSRYSDKYRPSPASQPTLKRKDLHQPFFPPDVFEDYFNPKRRKTGVSCTEYNPRYLIILLLAGTKSRKKKLNLDDMVEDAEEQVRNHFKSLL